MLLPLFFKVLSFPQFLRYNGEIDMIHIAWMECDTLKMSRRWVWNLEGKEWVRFVLKLPVCTKRMKWKCGAIVPLKKLCVEYVQFYQ